MLRLSSTNLSSGLYSSVSVGDTKQWENVLKEWTGHLETAKQAMQSMLQSSVKKGEVNQYYNYLELPIDIMWQDFGGYYS